jgi:phospholipid/cholesterol/gamma-HCH transport system permease protein
MSSTPQDHGPESVPASELRDLSPEPSGIAGLLGARALELVQVGFELYSVFVRTLYYCVRGRREQGATVGQMYEIGNRSLFFLTVVMGFIGMILVFQAGIQVKRILPELSLLGANYLELLIRDLAATISALMLATRVGAGIAAEIGSMVVTEQVDALRMCGVEPVEYLLVPRFLATLIMTSVLSVFGVGAAISLGALTAYQTFHVSFGVFFDLSKVHAGDLVTGGVKCIAYGAAIPIVSGYCGLRTHGGSEGVGWATTRAVVASSFAVIVLDFILSALAMFTWQAS